MRKTERRNGRASGYQGWGEEVVIRLRAVGHLKLRCVPKKEKNIFSHSRRHRKEKKMEKIDREEKEEKIL